MRKGLLVTPSSTAATTTTGRARPPTPPTLRAPPPINIWTQYGVRRGERGVMSVMSGHSNLYLTRSAAAVRTASALGAPTAAPPAAVASATLIPRRHCSRLLPLLLRPSNCLLFCQISALGLKVSVLRGVFSPLRVLRRTEHEAKGDEDKEERGGNQKSSISRWARRKGIVPGMAGGTAERRRTDA